MAEGMTILLTGDALNIFSKEGIEEFLNLIISYAVYIYPGFITLAISNFGKSKKLEKNKLLIIESFCISFLYILPISYFLEIEPCNYRPIHHLNLVILSVISAVLWNLFIHTEICRTLLNLLGLNTTIDDSIMDIMFYKGKRSVIITAYMDDEKIKYQGWLMHYEPDSSRKQQIVLCKYRVYEYNEEQKKYEIKTDYSHNEKRYVRLFEDNITRMEFNYDYSPFTFFQKIDYKFNKFCKEKFSRIKKLFRRKK